VVLLFQRRLDLCDNRGGFGSVLLLRNQETRAGKAVGRYHCWPCRIVSWRIDRPDILQGDPVSIRLQLRERVFRLDDIPPDDLAPFQSELSQVSAAASGFASHGSIRANIRPGIHVAIVQKQDQPTGRLTEGVVGDILTRSPTHPHGIKVRLETGEVGRVKEVLP